MDNSISQYQNTALKASSDVADMTASAPGLLSQLKQNLVGIFSKDNPVMQARDTALQGYLNAPSAARASILPTNMPTIEGRALTLSPTQQDAITTARTNANLVPLMGLNEIVKNQYGTIADLVNNAGGIYDSQIKAAQYSAQNAMDMYKQAVAIDQANKDRAAKTATGAGSMGFDLPSLLAAMSGSINNTSNMRPPLQSFDRPDTPATVANPYPVSQPLSQSAATPSWWDNLMGLFGATPKSDWDQAPTSTGVGLPSGALNFSGLNLPGLGGY